MAKYILFIIALVLLILPAAAYAINDNTGYESGFSNGVMTDHTNLTFETNLNGVVTVNGERFIGFALKGTYAGTEYIYTSMDYEWTWLHTINGKDHVFEAINDDDNFVWKQYWYFYENQPMKIEHSLKNNYAHPINDMQMYYIITVEDEDTITYNDNNYIVGDVKPVYIRQDLNNVEASVTFNSDIDFNFMDLISDGFNINEFYIGSGSVIDKPLIDIMAVGFTKSTGTLNPGQEILVDPTFSEHTTPCLSVCQLDGNTIVVGWFDSLLEDITFAIYNTNGTLITGPIDADTNVGMNAHVSATALNSTHFVLAWYDYGLVDDVTFAIYDVGGNLITGPIDAADDVGNFNSDVYVSAFNDTHFVFGWGDGSDQDVTFSVYDTSGNLITGPIDADTTSGYYGGVSVSALNSTHFVFGWFDDAENDATFSVYDVSGNLITGPIDADEDMGNGVVSVSALNETYFIISWFDNTDDDATFSIYDVSGNLITGPIDADTDVGTSYSVSASALNQSHFVISWADDVDGDITFSIYDVGGNLITGPIDADDDVGTSSVVSVSSYETATGIELSDDKFVIAYEKNDASGEFLVFNVDGSVYGIPTNPTIDHFHVSGSEDYEMNGSYSDTIQVGCGVSSDPDGGVVTHNLTLHYGNETFVSVINNTFTNSDINHGIYADIDFDTTSYYSVTDNYTLRLIATDDESESVTVWLDVNFSLQASSGTSNFTFLNELVSPVNVLQGITSTITINVLNPNATITTVYAKIQGTNYTMSNTIGNTWSYGFSSSLVTKHYITNYYSQDNYSIWNTTTSTAYINVLSSSGEGGGEAPAHTATPTPTATATATAIPTEPITNISIPGIFRIIAGEGLSMFKVNFGTDDPTYSKTLTHGNFSCVVVDDNKLATCSVSENKVRVILNPALRGVYNYQESQIKIYDPNGNLQRVFVEIVIIDLMGWVEVPNLYIPGAPYIMFEKDTKTDTVVGVRLWWIFLIGLLFAKRLK
ncbi:MAG: hypothetical protein K8S00_04305 [Bacteroidales bacterium]|nr:hypothetical protein [Bacteroidales bacterium]